MSYEVNVFFKVVNPSCARNNHECLNKYESFLHRHMKKFDMKRGDWVEESVRKLKQSFGNLERALKRLEEALQEDQENSLIIDGTIQRFEFTFEIYWKSLKRLLAWQGVETRTPRETLTQAFMAGWLEDEQAWLQMLKDRNTTSHAYDEEVAIRIVTHINHYFPQMKNTYISLVNRYIKGLDANEQTLD